MTCRLTELLGGMIHERPTWDRGGTAPLGQSGALAKMTLTQDGLLEFLKYAVERLGPGRHTTRGSILTSRMAL